MVEIETHHTNNTKWV